MSPGGALAVSVMPQVGPRWGRSVGREARGVNDPPPCLLYRIHYMGRSRSVNLIIMYTVTSFAYFTPCALRFNLHALVSASRSDCVRLAHQHRITVILDPTHNNGPHETPCVHICSSPSLRPVLLYVYGLLLRTPKAKREGQTCECSEVRGTPPCLRQRG